MLVARTRRHEPSRPKPVHTTSSSPYAFPLRREAVARCHLGRIQGDRLGSFGKDRVDFHGRAAEVFVAPRVDGAIGREHGEGLCRARHLQRGQAGSERPSGPSKDASKQGPQGRKEARSQGRKDASERASQVSWACLCCKPGVVLATCVTPPAAMIASLVLSGRSPPAIGSPHASTPPSPPRSLAAKAYLVAYTASTPAAPSKALRPAVGCSSSPPEMASPHTVSAPSACSAAKAAPVLAMLIAGLPSRPVSLVAWWGLG